MKKTDKDSLLLAFAIYLHNLLELSEISQMSPC